jgi:hypothetical protein
LAKRRRRGVLMLDTVEAQRRPGQLDAPQDLVFNVDEQSL